MPAAEPSPEPVPIRHRVLAASEPPGEVIARIVADLRGDDHARPALEDVDEPGVEPEDEARATPEAQLVAGSDGEGRSEDLAVAPADDYEALVRSAEAVLDAVDHALRRLDDGTYGTCEACRGAIADDLLAAAPTTSTCERHLRPPDAA